MHGSIGSSLLKTGEIKEALRRFKTSIEKQRKAIRLERDNRPSIDDILQFNIDNILIYNCDLTSSYSGQVMCLVRLGAIPVSEDSDRTQSAVDSVNDCLDEIKGSPYERVHFAGTWRAELPMRFFLFGHREELYEFAVQSLLNKRGHLDPAKREKWFDDALLCMTEINAAGSTNSTGTKRGPAKNELRYVAACTAALVGCGTSRVLWRKKAVEWLQSDLAYWNEVFERNRVETCDEVQETVKRWKADRDLDGIRLETELAKLSEPTERIACQTLWQAVDALHREAERIGQEHSRRARKLNTVCDGR